MLTYFSRPIITNNLTKPLNDGTIWYCSIHDNGSSSAKTMDEKGLFIIKTAHKGKVKFNVMSLEEPNEPNAKGLKATLENSIMKLGLNIKKKRKRGMLHFNSTQITFFFQILSVSTKNLFLKPPSWWYLYCSICPCLYTFFYQNVPIEIKRNETFFKNSVQIHLIWLEISLICFIN